MKNFENKVAVVSGAGSGIGRALALDLSKRSDVSEDGLGERRPPVFGRRPDRDRAYRPSPVLELDS